jgi:D-arabinose 1-dehydrogenase-like Zn-dependent alcohol dehydrogenase
LLAIGGRLVLVGSVFPERRVEFAAEQIVRKLLRIEGVHNYTPLDLDTALRFLERTDAPFGDFVGAEFPLDEVNAAFERALRGMDVRVAVRP